MATIRVPCSSANIGPGFDVIGLALSIWLEVRVTYRPEAALGEHQMNCTISYESPYGSEGVPLEPRNNLITRTAEYVMKCHGLRVFPVQTHVHIVNPIPLGRGLGSSGAAVVAGVMLADTACNFNLSKERMLDYCLMIERHPDNVAAALFGGFVGTYLMMLSPEDTQRKEIPLSEVLPEPAGGEDTGLNPPEPPRNIGHYEKFELASELKCLVVIPDFIVSTADARSVLPEKYTRAEAIFNLQRIPLLLRALQKSPPSPDTIYQAMQDKLHQPHRSRLVPGLEKILQLSPETNPGLCGICLSGAGPTILALVTENFEAVATAIVDIFRANDITRCEWKLLEPAITGAVVVDN